MIIGKSSLPEDRKVASKGYFHIKGNREKEKGNFLSDPHFWAERELPDPEAKGYH